MNLNQSPFSQSSKSEIMEQLQEMLFSVESQTSSLDKSKASCRSRVVRLKEILGEAERINGLLKLRMSMSNQ